MVKNKESLGRRNFSKAPTILHNHGHLSNSLEFIKETVALHHHVQVDSINGQLNTAL